MRFLLPLTIALTSCVTAVAPKPGPEPAWQPTTITQLRQNCNNAAAQQRMPSSHAPYFCECMVALLTENVTEKEYRMFDKETLNAVATVIGDTCMQVIFNQPKQEEPVI